MTYTISQTLNTNYGQLATAFPFIFALIVGNTLKQISNWKLERGTTVGFLEQMTGSLSVGSTVATQLLLHPTNILALLLLGLWSLSPLGSQSCLQILSVRGNTLDTGDSFLVAYFNTNLKPQFSLDNASVTLNAFFGASLLAPASIQSSSVDLWGNVKVPDFSRLQQSVSADSNGWFHIQSNEAVAYSSLIGIPLSGVPKEGNITFHMDSSYVAVSCYPNITYLGLGADPSKFESVFGFAEATPNEVTEDNGTFYDGVVESFGDNPVAASPFANSAVFSFDIAINQFYAEYTGLLTDYVDDSRVYYPATLLFQSWAGGMVAYCPITTTYVNSKVYCVSGLCSVIALQASPLPHPSPALTYFGFKDIFQNFTGPLLWNQNNLFGSGDITPSPSNKSSPLEVFIANPALISLADTEAVSMSGVSVDDISIRLQQVLNTYLYGSIYPAVLSGTIDLRNMSNVFTNIPANIGIETAATGTVLEVIYSTSFAWLSILFLATIAMLFAAIAGIWFSMMTRGPDILGYFSTTLRDSPYVNSSNFGSTMSGRERARRFGATRVKLVDVAGENEEGYIAIAEDGSDSHYRLVEQRYYK